MATIELWSSRHYYPPDHRGAAPAQGSLWVREVIGDEPGPWRRVEATSARRTLAHMLDAVTEPDE